MSRKLLKTCLVALIAAAVFNVVFTAMCVVRSGAAHRNPQRGRVTIHGQRLLATYDAGIGKSMVTWVAQPTTPADPGVTIADHVELPSWAAIDERTAAAIAARDPADLAVATHTSIAYGFPMLAFHGSVTHIPWATPPKHHRFGPDLPDIHPRRKYGTVRPAEPRTTPLLPIFPGVLVNTLAFAVPWLLLKLRHHVRNRARRRSIEGKNSGTADADPR